MAKDSWMMPALTGTGCTVGVIGWLVTRDVVWLPAGGAFGSALGLLLFLGLNLINPSPKNYPSIASLRIVAALIVVLVCLAVILLLIGNIRLNESNTRLNESNNRLSASNSRLRILQLINEEPTLVSATEDQVTKCYSGEAFVRDVWRDLDPNTKGRYRWSGTARIIDRYHDVRLNWPYVSVHGDVEIYVYGPETAFAIARTYKVVPGKDQVWSPALKEAWKFARDPSGRWQISALCFDIPPGKEESVLSELGYHKISKGD